MPRDSLTLLSELFRTWTTRVWVPAIVGQLPKSTPSTASTIVTGARSLLVIRASKRADAGDEFVIVNRHAALCPCSVHVNCATMHCILGFGLMTLDSLRSDAAEANSTSSQVRIDLIEVGVTRGRTNSGRLCVAST